MRRLKSAVTTQLKPPLWPAKRPHRLRAKAEPQSATHHGYHQNRVVKTQANTYGRASLRP